MGVDKKDIKTVVHLEPSLTAEAYIQEAGRGGRNGETAKAILIWSPENSFDFEAYGKESREYKMKVFAETEKCRRQVLLDALGAEQAFCSGCDNCYPQQKIQEADWQTAYRLVKKYRHFYDLETLEAELYERFRMDSLKRYGLDCWTHHDVTEITRQMTAYGYFKEGKILWRKRLSVCRRKEVV